MRKQHHIDKPAVVLSASNEGFVLEAEAAFQGKSDLGRDTLLKDLFS